MLNRLVIIFSFCAPLVGSVYHKHSSVTIDVFGKGIETAASEPPALALAGDPNIHAAINDIFATASSLRGTYESEKSGLPVLKDAVSNLVDKARDFLKKLSSDDGEIRKNIKDVFHIAESLRRKYNGGGLTMLRPAVCKLEDQVRNFQKVLSSNESEPVPPALPDKRPAPPDKSWPKPAKEPTFRGEDYGTGADLGKTWLKVLDLINENGLSDFKLLSNTTTLAKGANCLDKPDIQAARKDATRYFSAKVWGLPKQDEFKGAVVTKLGDKVLMFWHNSAYSNWFEMCDFSKNSEHDGEPGAPKLRITVGSIPWVFSNSESILFGIKEKMYYQKQRSLSELWSFHELNHAGASKDRINYDPAKRAAANFLWESFEFVVMMGATVCVVKFGQDTALREMLLLAHDKRVWAFEAAPNDSLWGVAATGLEMLYALQKQDIENLAWWRLDYDGDTEVQSVDRDELKKGNQVKAEDTFNKKTIGTKERRRMNGLGKAITLAGMVVADYRKKNEEWWAKQDLRMVLKWVVDKMLAKMAPAKKPSIKRMFAALRLMLDNVVEHVDFDEVEGVTELSKDVKSTKSSQRVIDYVKLFDDSGDIPLTPVEEAKEETWTEKRETRLVEPSYCGRRKKGGGGGGGAKPAASKVAGTTAVDEMRKEIKDRIGPAVSNPSVNELRKLLDKRDFADAVDKKQLSEFDRALLKFHNNYFKKDLQRLRVKGIVEMKLESKGTDKWSEDLLVHLRKAGFKSDKKVDEALIGNTKDFGKYLEEIWTR